MISRSPLRSIEPPGRMAFELSHARREYPGASGPVVALADATIDVAVGTSVAVMGRSGSGKSTLLGLLGLMDKPTAGVIKIFGTDATALNDTACSKLRNQQIGFVFQNDYLLPRLTILENVVLPLTYANRATNGDEAGNVALAKVGLDGKQRRFPHQLSGGERQRAALARAIVNQPKILLADEPTGNLDTRTADQVMDLITDINRSGVTIMIVTHDDRVAARCGRRTRIEDGRLLV